MQTAFFLGLIAVTLEAAENTVIGRWQTGGQDGIDAVTVEQTSMHGDTPHTAGLVDRLVKQYGLGEDSQVSLAKLMRQTASPTAQHYPGGFTAQEWDEQVRNTLAANAPRYVEDALGLHRKILAGAAPADATPAPTPARTSQSWGKFLYEDGHVVLLCPPGKRLLRSDVKHHRGHQWGLMADTPGRCIACSGGRYQPRRGADQCFLCPPGKFTSEQGNAACRACPAGRFQPAAGATFCHDERLRGLERVDENGKLVTHVQKPHYMPKAALHCCTEKCVALQVTAQEAAQRAWQHANPTWKEGEAFFLPATDAEAKHDCALGCAMWMRHSSLNWAGSHWRLRLLDRCNKDCKDAPLWARQGKGHAWTPGGAVPSTTGACMAGCKHFIECQFEQDDKFASVQLMSGGSNYEAP